LNSVSATATQQRSGSASTAQSRGPNLDEAVRLLLRYCRGNEWAGFDPYDALNSRLFDSTPFSKNRMCRLALTQILKRLPINLRPLLLIPKTQNPKAIALFLMALLKLSKLGRLGEEHDVNSLIDTLELLRSQDTPYCCWGYSFPWQTRTIVVPRGTPNLVCTSFVANALLDAFENNGQARCLEMSISAAEYLLNELFWTAEDATAGFSYPLPQLQSSVHNANFLGAALLCRAYRQSGEKKFLEPALRAARYSVSRQHEDGSWGYGEHATQRWVDNFHTGYNLCALRDICLYAETSEFEPNIRRGFEFYRRHFFREDGAPKYFHNRTYPIDTHSVAQSIITLLTLKEFDGNNFNLAYHVFKWAMTNMWDKTGYFYYQKLPFYTSRVSYMRWSQAWMLLALSMLLNNCE
jgi:hypothetical protein